MDKQRFKNKYAGVGRGCGAKWKRAVFTVEAAVIVPLSVTMIALLIGFCYYVHQSNWCMGAALESAEKSVECGIEGKSKTAGKNRMDTRISEVPVLTGKIETTALEETKVKISYEGKILEKVFGGLFGFKGEASLIRYDPVKLKRIEFLINKMKE